MPWEKTTNAFSTDSADTAASKSIQSSNMVGSVCGKSTPASSKEDGLYQRMVLDQLRRLVRRLGPSGWMSKSTLSFSGAFPVNSFRLGKADAYLDGLPITEVGSTLNSESESQITMPAPPGSGSRDDLAFLEVWLAEVPGSIASTPSSVNKPSPTAIYKYGNLLFGGTNPVDDINEVNFEIRRRVQVQYRIRTVTGVNFTTYPKGVPDPVVFAQGPLVSASAINYVAVGDDSGLFRAGSGSSAHQTALGTLDGYVYALPMFRVARTAGDTTIDTNEVTDLRDIWSGSPAARESYGKGSDIASAATITPVGVARLYHLTGTVNVEAIATRDVDTRLTFRVINGLNFIHDVTKLLLPFGKIYRAVADEMVTFISLGAGLWILEARSGPPECVGSGQDFWGTSPPDGYLFANSTTERSCTVFEGVFTELLPSLAVYNARGTPLGDFTADAGTNALTLAAHGMVNGTVCHLSNAGGALPGGLATLTKYYVLNATSNTWQLSLTRNGAAIDLTSTGTGTHSLYRNFLIPDLRSRTVVYAGTGTLTESVAASAVSTGGDTWTVVSNKDKWITGMQVVLSTTGSLPTGLSAGPTYYLVRGGATTVYFASSLLNAQNGIVIDLTSQGSGIHTITHTLEARSIGARGGETEHAQSLTELVGHNHPYDKPIGAGSTFANGVNVGYVSTPSGSAGSNAYTPNMPPFMVANYMLRT